VAEATTHKDFRVVTQTLKPAELVKLTSWLKATTYKDSGLPHRS
jgi:hypothetical protein